MNETWLNPIAPLLKLVQQPRHYVMDDPDRCNCDVDLVPMAVGDSMSSPSLPKHFRK